MAGSWTRESGDARAGHLDHFPAGLGAVAAGGGALLHVFVVGELLALGAAQVARLAAGVAGKAHERAVPGHELGGHGAERAAVVTGLQRTEVFLLTLGEHRRAVVEAGFALLGTIYAS